MGKTIELNAVCVADWEADYLREINPSNPLKGFFGGISRIIKDAGGTTVTDGVVTAFEDIDGDEHWTPFREEFREESKLEVPPVMRVKVTSHRKVDISHPMWWKDGAGKLAAIQRVPLPAGSLIGGWTLDLRALLDEIRREPDAA